MSKWVLHVSHGGGYSDIIHYASSLDELDELRESVRNHPKYWGHCYHGDNSLCDFCWVHKKNT